MEHTAIRSMRQRPVAHDRTYLTLLAAACLIVAAVPAHAAQVTLRNATWRPHVTIEIRVGSSQNCQQNNARPSQNIGFGRSITLQGSIVCVRREIDPANPTGSWAEWTIYEGDIVDDIQ
jgi:hypothetical protein